MADPKFEGDIHVSVGALIERNGKYLMIDRKLPPLGFAGIAGHIDKNESPEQALHREVKEETDLKIEDHRLIFDEVLDFEPCKSGIQKHRWYLYRCQTSGMLNLNIIEQNSIGWYSPEQIKSKKLEKAWEYFFKKLGLI